jgi:Domain of unknown function (DUF4926)
LSLLLLIETMEPKLLDTIALLVNVPPTNLSLVEGKNLLESGLPIGLVGTIVYIHQREKETSQYLVEFSNSQGQEEAMATLDGQQFVVLQYELAAA